MKRSEMIMLMFAWMLEPPKNISQIHDGGQQMYKMMEFILGKIEEAGMLPPLNEQQIQEGIDLGFEKVVRACELEWEEE